jgi:hypothetical protein
VVREKLVRNIIVVGDSKTVGKKGNEVHNKQEANMIIPLQQRLKKRICTHSKMVHLFA